MGNSKLKLTVPDWVIENAVDKYLSDIFGREVVWYEFSPKDIHLVVEEYLSEPHSIDFEKFELEDEW